jgi:hypothetical protein
MQVAAERLEKFYARMRLEEADVILHFGWSELCAGVLSKRVKKTARVIVFEPDEKRLEPFTDSRFEFVIGTNVATFFENWGLGNYGETDQFLWIELPAVSSRYSATAEALKRRFRTHLRDRAANLLTHFQNGEKYFENAIGNFKFQDAADAGRLFSRFVGVPLVIVSAGPSLDRNIQELADFENRCFILSVDTALRPLLSAGIRPHAVITADPTEMNAQHVVGRMPLETYLIAEQAVHPSALAAASRRFLFGLGLFPDPLFGKFRFRKSRVDAWGSVATSALDLACRMGANPIIFAGQDFAYSWDREYASNTIYHGNYFDVRESGTVRERDIYGNEVRTTENLVAYRDYFVRRIKQAGGVRFINATEGGILAQSVDILSLRAALQECAQSVIDVEQTLQWCHVPSKPATDALLHLSNVLKTRRTDCDCLHGFLELTAKEHLLRQNDAEIEKKILWGLQWLQSQR